MKKVVFLFIVAVLLFSCNKELVEKPDNLIDLKVMKNIFYDIALLDAIKYQNSDSLFKNGINPKTYIYKKYKIDSLQYAKSSAYYASDLKVYKQIFDELNERLKKEKDAIDLINKKAEKKENALNKAKGNKIKDSILKLQKTKELKIKNEKDSIIKLQKVKELKLKKLKDSIDKVNAEKKKIKVKNK